MKTIKVFKIGNSQVIWMPGEFIISKAGEGYILYPNDDPWWSLKQSIGKMPEDFMEEREQPTWDEVEKRENF